MAVISNLEGCSHSGNSVIFGERRLQFRSTPGLKTRISWPSKNRLAVGQLGKPDKNSGVCTALFGEKIARSGAFSRHSDILVKWSPAVVVESSLPEPPTAVFLHGILGSRKNWGTFTRRLAQEFPTWQVRQLRLTPWVIVGHSFGGKVASSMVDQAAKPLARPVRVWVLDATPGIVCPGGDGEDHPEELISVLSTLPNEVSSKRDIVDALVKKGFSKDVAQCVVTNLQPTNSLGSSPSTFSRVFDLKKLVEDVPRGVHVNFLKAERSLHIWALGDLQRIRVAEELAAEEACGVEMHVLEDAGHWVHADNPDGLFRILSSSFY